MASQLEILLREGPHFARLLGAPGDEEALSTYRRELEARGDPKAELLGLEAALSSPKPPDDAPVRRARLEELIAKVDPFWWTVVRRHAPLRNCGAARPSAGPVRFAYRCPRTWESLRPTASPTERHCDGCRERVFLCASAEEAAARARAGECIAVPARLAHEVRQQVTAHVTGRPDAESLWAARIFGGEER